MSDAEHRDPTQAGATSGDTVRIAVCLKWVAHPGEPDDERFSGMSAADASALEWALRQADAIRGRGAVGGSDRAGSPTGTDTSVEVTAITVGPAGAERVVRDALARGATRALRVEGPKGADSADVAAALAAVLGDHDWIWCGDYSADRGTGSVPAFLAAAAGARQALGVIHVDLDAASHPGANTSASTGTADSHNNSNSSGPTLGLTRRLDGGRRELLTALAPAVVSVEGATAPLRRASLPAVRAAASRPVEVVHPGTPLSSHDAVIVPYRPRARVLPAPAGDDALDRLRVLTDAAAASAARGETVEATPADAAARIIGAMRGWGYLD